MGSHDSASLLDHPRLSRSVSDDDTSIVPDSDPVTHMLEYRRTSMLHTSTLHKEEKINLNQDATELSDSDEPIGRETGPRRIILSDDVSMKSLPHKPPFGNVAVRKARSPLNTLRSPSSTNTSVEANSVVPSANFEVSSDSEPNTFAHFAWADKPLQTRRRNTRTSAWEPSPHTKSIVSNIPQKKAKMLHYSFGEEEFGRLTLCVVCESEWTIKKTASSKIDHLRKCQKKNGFTDETMRLRLQKELSYLLPEKTAKDDSDKTLMDNMMDGTPPKKKKKRGQTAITVVEISHQHELVRSRARDLFELPGLSVSVDSEGDSRAHHFPISRLGTNRQHHLTLGENGPVVSSSTPFDSGSAEYSILEYSLSEKIWNQPPLETPVLPETSTPSRAALACDEEEDILSPDYLKLPSYLPPLLPYSDKLRGDARLLPY